MRPSMPNPLSAADEGRPADPPARRFRPRLVPDARGDRGGRGVRGGRQLAAGPDAREGSRCARSSTRRRRRRRSRSRACPPPPIGRRCATAPSPRPASTWPTRQILIDNKVAAGRAGFHVVTPLSLADGRVVLVNRGWIAQTASRAVLPEAPPPPGVVTVQGRIAIPAAGYLELKPEATSGSIRQNLDPARFAAATGLAVIAGGHRGDGGARARRRAGARLAGAGFRHRNAPDLHGAVVRVRAARGRAVALVPSPASRRGATWLRTRHRWGRARRTRARAAASARCC